MRFAVPATLIALSLLIGCNGSDSGETDSDVDTFVWPDCTDADGDGICAEDGDCDDKDPEVYPGQRESCNSKDDNCNDTTDEGLPDADQDGICDGEDAEDCDGVDNDGDNLVDEEYPDSDGNGIADCVDVETCDGRDNNGDGRIDEGFDADLDGASQCGDIDGKGQDCDDSNGDVFPGADETVDGIDNDCDRLIDEGAWLAGDLVITELMVNPNAVGDPSGEWIEVFNNSGRELTLNGIQLRDSNGQNHTIDSDEIVEVAAGGYAVLAINGRPDQNGRVTTDYVYTGMSLSNQIDDIQLWVNDEVSGVTNSTMLDSVAWDETYPVLAGTSMALEPDFSDPTSNDDVLYWCPAAAEWALGSDFGSPGAANPTCTTFDHDGDGFAPASGDCDDNDDSVYPGAPEIDATVDNDCDGDAEAGPIASAKVETSVSNSEVCGITYLDASNTSDPDGDEVVSYEWTVKAKPTGSTLEDADIRNNTRDFASFEADKDGVYEFDVFGFDAGGARGVGDSVSVTIAARTDNNDPLADAGDSQVATESGKCVSIGGGKFNCTSCKNLTFDLDGTDSRDFDGDSLSYLWTVTSGPGALTKRDEGETSVLVSGATPAPGGRGTSTVFIDLVVTDCMGAASTADTVAIVYTCEDN
ncbi:MAG: MopE-related protein [Myxococcota bacterium]